MANWFQEVGEGFQILAEVEFDEQQLATATPNTPVTFPIPANKVIKGVGKVNGKRIDFVGVVLQVEP